MQRSRLPARVLAFASSKGYGASFLSGVRENSSTGASTSKSTYNVPEGHHSSDLTPTVCTIGLGRRRDLCMRQDLSLYKDTTKLSLADVFRGSKSLVVGFPGGKVCTHQHLPGYLKAVDELKKNGIDKVVCVSVCEPGRLKDWATEHGFSKEPMLDIVADPNGGFVRLLGLEHDSGSESGAKCQRFAAIVDNGILLRLRVEQGPAELKCSDVKSMLKTWKEAFPPL